MFCIFPVHDGKVMRPSGFPSGSWQVKLTLIVPMRDGPGHGQVPRIFVFSVGEHHHICLVFLALPLAEQYITCFSLVGKTPSWRTIEWNHEMHDIVSNRRNIVEHLGQGATRCKGSLQ